MKFGVFTAILFLLSSQGISQRGHAETAIIKQVSAQDVRAFMDTTSVPAIINFWATWCGPCTREIRWFDSIIVKKSSPVKLLLVSLDFARDYPAKLSAFVARQGYKGEVVFLNEMNARDYISVINKKWTGQIPASIFINNRKRYYQLFNQQLPPKRFQLELDKLVD